MKTYEERRDMIVDYAWLACIMDLGNLDRDMHKDIKRTVQDAVNNAYYDGIEDTKWLEVVMRRLL
jgi:hypothetical protein